MHTPHCTSPSLSPATRACIPMTERGCSSQPLVLVPILPGQCSGLPGQGCGRDALQQDRKGAALPFSAHRRIFFWLSGNSNIYKESLFSDSEKSTEPFWQEWNGEKKCNFRKAKLFSLDYFFSKIKQNKHFPLFETPDMWAVKAVTHYVEEPLAGVADCEFQVRQQIGLEMCKNTKKGKKNLLSVNLVNGQWEKVGRYSCDFKQATVFLREPRKFKKSFWEQQNSCSFLQITYLMPRKFLK